MKREEKDIFGELLRVLAKRQEEDQDMGVEDEVGIFCFCLTLIFCSQVDLHTVFRCIFCGHAFTTKDEKMKHMQVSPQC